MIQQDSTEQREKEKWKRLLTWMQTRGLDLSQLSVEPRTRPDAGRGLFVTRTLHPSNEPFLVIPAATLLNSRTLKPIYPSIALEGFSDSPSSRLILNGTQLLSLHLALHRPKGDSYSNDPDFGPYIDTLPRSCDGHPLVWLVKEKLGKATLREGTLLRNLPPSVIKELQDVEKRFWGDWDIAVQAKQKHLKELKSQNGSLFEIEDFIWGWLIVNTRCIYSDIFRKDLPLSNLTMFPIVDFANHTTTLPRVTWKKPSKDARVPRGGDILKAHDYAFLPPEQTIREGEEVFLKYGDHSNRTLFCEYGFVDESADQEVDVSDLIDDLINKKCAAGRIRDLIPEVAQQFMSKLRIYTVPPPAHPSWSLHCVLRLINIAFPSDLSLKPDSTEMEKILQPWRAVTLGEADVVSEDNEFAVRQDLESICKILMIRSSEAIRRTESEENGAGRGGLADESNWRGYAGACVRRLWEEEEHVARSVLESLSISGQAL